MAQDAVKETKETEKEREKEVKPRAGAGGSAAGDALSTVGSLPTRTRTFLGDVRAELRRVTWPTRRQVQATTVVVIVTVFFFGAYFGILDWFFTWAVSRILQLGQ
jgi:preprotein translocase subunit SecE